MAVPGGTKAIEGSRGGHLWCGTHVRTVAGEEAATVIGEEVADWRLVSGGGG
jgi:hypothetical protein